MLAGKVRGAVEGVVANASAAAEVDTLGEAGAIGVPDAQEGGAVDSVLVVAEVGAVGVVEHMVAVLVIVGEIRAIVAIQVTAEDGGVCFPVAACEIALGARQSPVDRHLILQLEAGGARIKGIALPPRRVGPIRHPDLGTG